jgi:hypothetical protein
VGGGGKNFLHELRILEFFSCDHERMMLNRCCTYTHVASEFIHTKHIYIYVYVYAHNLIDNVKMCIVRLSDV